MLASSVTRQLITDFARRPSPDPPPPPTLTHMQTEVLRLISRSLSNAKTSDTLVLAQQTTKIYVGRILAKLQVQSDHHQVDLGGAHQALRQRVPDACARTTGFSASPMAMMLVRRLIAECGGI
jgi:DNA-binding CsgD family transcriptional regulator